ncbi:MAG TPA: sensor domain-containing diguanylate cyclase [Planctomycetota bacterium]|nr:sensor domain-containing diguanylate cyclase [Planctomycetota bacterium]
MAAPSMSRKSTPSDSSAHLNLRPILDVVKKINSERNLRRLINMILDTAVEFSNATRGTIAIFKGESFNAELSRHRTRGEINHSEIPQLAGVLRRVHKSGKELLVEDISEDAGLRPPALLAGRDALSILCLPLRVKSRLMGAVYIDNTDEKSAFGPREQEFAEILAEHAAIAIENALLYRKSTQDRVTNVYNHSAFEQFLDDEVDLARRGNYPCGLLMIDVDDFKVINDVHGHEVGNDVLRNVAYTLSTTVRGADIVARAQGKPNAPVVARYGGDEFEIILPNATREGALATAKRLATLFKGQKFMCGSKRLKLSVSIGVAVYPDDAPDTHELLLRADEALYNAKRAGKGRAAAWKTPGSAKTGPIPVQSPKKS